MSPLLAGFFLLWPLERFKDAHARQVKMLKVAEQPCSLPGWGKCSSGSVLCRPALA